LETGQTAISRLLEGNGRSEPLRWGSITGEAVDSEVYENEVFPLKEFEERTGRGERKLEVEGRAGARKTIGEARQKNETALAPNLSGFQKFIQLSHRNTEQNKASSSRSERASGENSGRIRETTLLYYFSSS